MTDTEETRSPIDIARSALAVIQNRMGVSRLGKAMYTEVNADILAMRDAEAALRALIAEREAPILMLGEARVAADDLRNAAVEPWEIEACDKIREFLADGFRRQRPIADAQAPAVDCPHWAPGRITLRKGCTACEADAARNA